MCDRFEEKILHDPIHLQLKEALDYLKYQVVMEKVIKMSYQASSFPRMLPFGLNVITLAILRCKYTMVCAGKFKERCRMTKILSPSGASWG